MRTARHRRRAAADGAGRTNFTPFAARTQQYLREQLGQAEGKTELPADYVALEQRVDALRLVHQKLLAVT